ncbi:MAG: DeoR/GlpR family DNA-binding transcription regulator [Melioribacteraceae bacterium]|nr:DeoR/GlpR family DNA-binding transcription regulator [Melioribacteraceae bacterium]
MKKQIREKYILNTLYKNGEISVNQIINTFNVTSMTARRDITKLAEDGYLIRTHGGALRSDPLDNMFSFATRIDSNKLNKIKIGRSAAKFVKNNDTIYIDSGTTLIRMCPFLKDRKGITVITNSLPAAAELTNYSNIKVTLIGGDIIHERRSIYGNIATEQAERYSVIKAFIGTDGLSLKNGLTAYGNNESQVSNIMAGSANEVFLLCDSSKIEHDSTYKFAKLSSIDYLITDSGIDKRIIQKYKKEKINLIVV